MCTCMEGRGWKVTNANIHKHKISQSRTELDFLIVFLLALTKGKYMCFVTQ